MTAPDRYVRPAEFAAEMGVSESTLEWWDKRGHGPKRLVISAGVRGYKRSEIEAFKASLEQGGAA